MPLENFPSDPVFQCRLSEPSQPFERGRSRSGGEMDERLKLQLQAQTLELLSDGRTYVSVVGVLAPAQFERKRCPCSQMCTK